MKTTFAILALTLLSAASPTLASTDGQADRPIEQSARYYQADSAISFGALFLAAGVMMAASVSGQRRQLRLAEATPVRAQRSLPGQDRWRDEVLRNLEADLETFSRGLRRAA